jgi:hypothetical protein
MGVVVVEECSAGNLAAEAPAAEGAATEEEVEIEEIVCPEEEKVALQCIHIARKQGDEWVFYEKDHSNHVVRKLQRTVEDLMGLIKVRGLRTQSCLSSLCLGISVTDASLYCRVLKKRQNTESGVLIRSSRQWRRTRP